MKGQTQAVTAVMITGIMIGTITAVYIWGTPLLEKREGQAQLDQIENDVIGLKDGIESISNAGTGSGSEIDIRLDNGEVTVNQTGNFIDITTSASNSNYPVDTWRLLEGDSLQGLSFAAGDYGIRGRETPGVVAVNAEEGSDRVTYRVEFRNLQDERFETPRMEQTDLQLAGSERSSDDTTISIVNQGAQVDENGFTLQNGETIDLERQVVRVDLQ